MRCKKCHKLRKACWPWGTPQGDEQYLFLNNNLNIFNTKPSSDNNNNTK